MYCVYETGTMDSFNSEISLWPLVIILETPFHGIKGAFLCRTSGMFGIWKQREAAYLLLQTKSSNRPNGIGMVLVKLL